MPNDTADETGPPLGICQNGHSRTACLRLAAAALTMDQPPLARPLVRYLTKKEAAAHLGIGVTLPASCDIPTVRFGRRCIYDRVDLDLRPDEYKPRGRAGKECLSPVQPESTGALTRATGGLQQHYPTASAYAKALGLRTEKRQKPCSPSSIAGMLLSLEKFRRKNGGVIAPC